MPTLGNPGYPGWEDDVLGQAEEHYKTMQQAKEYYKGSPSTSLSKATPVKSNTKLSNNIRAKLPNARPKLPSGTIPTGLNVNLASNNIRAKLPNTRPMLPNTPLKVKIPKFIKEVGSSSFLKNKSTRIALGAAAALATAYVGRELLSADPGTTEAGPKVLPPQEHRATKLETAGKALIYAGTLALATKLPKLNKTIKRTIYKGIAKSTKPVIASGLSGYGRHAIAMFATKQIGDSIFKGESLTQDIFKNAAFSLATAAPMAMSARGLRTAWKSGTIRAIKNEAHIANIEAVAYIQKTKFVNKIKTSKAVESIKGLFRIPKGETSRKYSDIVQAYSNRATSDSVLNYTKGEYDTWLKSMYAKLPDLENVDILAHNRALAEIGSAERSVAKQREAIKLSFKHKKVSSRYRKAGITRKSALDELKTTFGDEVNRLVGFEDDTLKGLMADKNVYNLKGTTVNLNKLNPFRSLNVVTTAASAHTSGILSTVIGLFSHQGYKAPIRASLGEGKYFIRKAGSSLGDVYKGTGPERKIIERNKHLIENRVRRVAKSVDEIAIDKGWNTNTNTFTDKLFQKAGKLLNVKSNSWAARKLNKAGEALGTKDIGYKTKLHSVARKFGFSSADKVSHSVFQNVKAAYSKDTMYVPFMSEVFAGLGKSIDDLVFKGKSPGLSKYKKSIDAIKEAAKEEHSLLFKAGKSPLFKAVNRSESISYRFAQILEKPLRLAEDLGIGGILPSISGGPGSFIGTLMVKRILPAALVYEGARFADFASRKITGLGIWEGIGPISLGADAIAGLNVAGGYLRDKLGVTKAGDYLEDLMPGSITSSSSKLLRMSSAPVLIHKLGSTFGAVGSKARGVQLALGLAMSYFVGGDLTSAKSGPQLKSEYFGDEEVAIKKGRWWEFGKQPFEGQGVEFYRPNWYRLQKSHYKEKALYGSESKYWLKGSWASPGKYTDPYYFEKLHYEDRPYPMTGRLFADVPLVGPLLEPIGQLIKPRRYMHLEDLYPSSGIGTSGGYGAPGGSLAQFGVPSSFFKSNLPRLDQGRKTYPMKAPEYVNPNLVAASDQAYRLSEWLGLRGFASQSIVKMATGVAEFNVAQGKMVLDDPTYATSFSRDYWDRDLGGLAGATEFFRRLFPRPRRSSERYNPTRNTMPEWMPGEDYFTNFKIGDPYTKIKMGEARLPGKGYEALHGKSIDNFTSMDAFKVLADVAPYSSQYKNLKSHLMETLEPGDRGKFDKIVDQVESRYDVKEFSPRKFTYGDTDKYNVIEKGIGRVWEEISHLHTPFNTKLLHKRSALEDYKRSMVYGRNTAFWDSPYRDFIRPMFSEMTAPADSVVGSAVKTAAMTGLAMGLAAMALKSGSPLRKMAIGVAGGAVAGTSIYQNVRKGLGYAIDVPDEVEERADVEDYFDKLAYLKYSRLENQSKDPDEKMFYGYKKGRTLTGIDPYSDWRNIISAVPKKERAYFKAFINASEGERPQIMEIAPSYMKRIYQAQWEQVDQAKGLYGTLQYIDMPAMEEEIAEFQESAYVPDDKWIGWHENVDLNKVKLKSVVAAGMTPQDFNFWDKDVAELKRMSYIPTIALDKMDYNDYNEVAPHDVRKQLLEKKGRKKSYRLVDFSSEGSFEFNITVHQNKINTLNDIKYNKKRIGVEY